jgi:hypothetical protein
VKTEWRKNSNTVSRDSVGVSLWTRLIAPKLDAAYYQFCEHKYCSFACNNYLEPQRELQGTVQTVNFDGLGINKGARLGI